MSGRIVAEIFGGLGNQLFQYAAGYSLACRTGGQLLLYPQPGSTRPFVLDRLALDIVPAPKRFHERAIARLSRETGMPVPGVYRPRNFHLEPRFLDLKPPVRLIGYFQSERFFADVADEVRGLFRLRQGFSPAAQRIAAAIAAAELPVSIHVRRGDYANPGAAVYHPILPAEYYRRATLLLSRLLGAEPHYFIFSDEPDAAAETLGFLSERTVAIGDPLRPEEEVFLMAQCRHHIIANSTFSWWGAWLNPNPAKTIIAPRQWFTPFGLRHMNIADLVPAGWITI
jgi:hypothetical protein